MTMSTVGSCVTNFLLRILVLAVFFGTPYLATRKWSKSVNAQPAAALDVTQLAEEVEQPPAAEHHLYTVDDLQRLGFTDDDIQLVAAQEYKKLSRKKFWQLLQFQETFPVPHPNGGTVHVPTSMIGFSDERNEMELPGSVFAEGSPHWVR